MGTNAQFNGPCTVTISFDGVSALVAETGNPVITTASVTTLAGTTTGSFYKWNWNQLQI
jgi:hypothetical protein